MQTGIPEFDHECFFITPIGDEGSPERARADAVLRAIVEPVASSVGLTAIRADRIEEGGHITLQVIEHICRAKLAIADLTGRNLNVYYEVGMRHTARAPLILIADTSEQKRIPFDLLQQRTIFFADDMAGTAACLETSRQQAERAVAGHLDSPVDAAVNLRSLQEGSPVEQVVAELVDRVESLAEAVNRPRRGVIRRPGIPPRVMSDLSTQTAKIIGLALNREDEELRRQATTLLGILIENSPSRLPPKLVYENPETGATELPASFFETFADATGDAPAYGAPDPIPPAEPTDTEGDVPPPEEPS